MEPRFDRLSGDYQELLKDPIRDRFVGQESQFFHVRKRDLIREFFRAKRIDPAKLAYLDFGCGKGELLTLLRHDFARAAGCDVSSEMMQSIEGIETRLQGNPLQIPFPDRSFDFITAVCVYHHVPPDARAALTAEVRRVLCPGGVFCIIEHNPYNPVTRLIVSRTPVDEDAILLNPGEARGLLRSQGFAVREQSYFLYVPRSLYRSCAFLERLLKSVPMGGQYAVFAS